MAIDDIIREIKLLSEDDQGRVAQYVSALLAVSRDERVSSAASDPIGEEPFIGMWRDRDVLTDTESWVRQLRIREWPAREV